MAAAPVQTVTASASSRTALICHADDALNLEGLARWLASFSNLAAVVVLEEPRQRLWKRIRREIRRVGFLRFFDVLAFRLYYRVVFSRRDRRWEAETLAELCRRYPPLPPTTSVLHARSPNDSAVEQLLEQAAPDIVIARCKTLLKPAVFTIPKQGTFVMHPGICPEYRNAHGCFWALANDDLGNVGMTLLRIDTGVDTGPVYGYFRCAFDERVDSHVVIQRKVVFYNLDEIRERLLEIHENRARPLNTAGRPSAEWGQPWLSAYRRWQRRARQRRSRADRPALP